MLITLVVLLTGGVVLVDGVELLLVGLLWVLGIDVTVVLGVVEGDWDVLDALVVVLLELLVLSNFIL